VIDGAGSKWFSGTAIQQIGENCSVLGSRYTEVMIGGVGSYGGASGRGWSRRATPIGSRSSSPSSGEILITAEAAAAGGFETTGLERRTLELRGRERSVDAWVARARA